MKAATFFFGFLTMSGALVAFKATSPGAAQRATVVFYMGTECTVTASYTSRIQSLVKQYEPRGISFEGLFPQASDDEQKVIEFAKERGFAFPCRLDHSGVQAKKDHIETVPTVVVRDTSGKELYRGAIDDNATTDLVKKKYLSDALQAIVSGRPVTVTKTDAFGCVFTPGHEVRPVIQPTYADQVASILNQHCVSCHRPGQVAPFSLIGYENAKNWAPTIAKFTREGRMPPWKAIAGVGDFKNDNRLSSEELEVLQLWAKTGAPRGDAANEPKPPTFPTGWALGEPDEVLQIPKPFAIAADGRDEYWHFVLTPQITEPVYVQAIDVHPGNRKIVHHVILWLDEKGQSDKILAREGKNGAYLSFGSPGFMPDNSLGGWAPGLQPARLPDDAGILLKPGTRVVLEVHYHKDGKPETDQTKVALYYAKDTRSVKNPVRIAWLANLGIDIKPGLPDQKFVQTVPIPVDVKLYGLLPHMHLLGRKMKATWVKPDGTEQPLIQVDDWDFNWQFMYSLKQPLLLTRGSKVRIEAVYDNSSNNPNNPNDPPKEVRWGEQTTDEMMLLVAAISIPGRPQARWGGF